MDGVAKGLAAASHLLTVALGYYAVVGVSCRQPPATHHAAHARSCVRLLINDDEPGLLQDYDDFLERLAPHAPISQYRHNKTGEDNGDAHIKRQLMGREVVVAVTDGALDLGPWEQIFYGDFDGRRKKRVLVKIIGE